MVHITKKSLLKSKVKPLLKSKVKPLLKSKVKPKKVTSKRIFGQNEPSKVLDMGSGNYNRDPNVTHSVNLETSDTDRKYITEIKDRMSPEQYEQRIADLEKVKPNHYEGVDYNKGLPFKRNTFDKVTSNASLAGYGEQAAYDHAKKVIKSGGSFQVHSTSDFELPKVIRYAKKSGFSDITVERDNVENNHVYAQSPTVGQVIKNKVSGLFHRESENAKKIDDMPVKKVVSEYYKKMGYEHYNPLEYMARNDPMMKHTLKQHKKTTSTWDMLRSSQKDSMGGHDYADIVGVDSKGKIYGNIFITGAYEGQQTKTGYYPELYHEAKDTDATVSGMRDVLKGNIPIKQIGSSNRKKVKLTKKRKIKKRLYNPK